MTKRHSNPVLSYRRAEGRIFHDFFPILHAELLHIQMYWYAKLIPSSIVWHVALWQSVISVSNEMLPPFI
jgi:hypothetical protein